MKNNKLGKLIGKYEISSDQEKRWARKGNKKSNLEMNSCQKNIREMILKAAKIWMKEKTRK